MPMATINTLLSLSVWMKGCLMPRQELLGPTYSSPSRCPWSFRIWAHALKRQTWLQKFCKQVGSSLNERMYVLTLATQAFWRTSVTAGKPAAQAALLGPDKHRLAVHAELPGNRSDGIPTPEERSRSQSPGLHHAPVSSGTYAVVGHKPTVSSEMNVSTY